MIERTYSHKSDGRQSSTGHSVHSAASGRANSLGLDTPFLSLGQSPLDTPGLTPGLSFLGPVPSIIRCWMNDDWKHETMLYAAVCSGSYRSFLDRRLVDRLGMLDLVRETDSGSKLIKLPVYLPEAVVRSASSRSSSPTPGLARVPSLTIDFTVASESASENERSIQIFIGCDVLHKNNADILFTSQRIILFDDDHSKIFDTHGSPRGRPHLQKFGFDKLWSDCYERRVLSENGRASPSGTSAIRQEDTGTHSTGIRNGTCESSTSA